MNVLVLNSGSSSLKFQVIATDLERIKQYKDERICRGEVEGIGGEAIVKIQYRERAKPDVHGVVARHSRYPGISGSLHRVRSIRRDRDQEHG